MKIFKSSMSAVGMMPLCSAEPAQLGFNLRLPGAKLGQDT